MFAFKAVGVRLRSGPLNPYSCSLCTIETGVFVFPVVGIGADSPPKPPDLLSGFFEASDVVPCPPGWGVRVGPATAEIATAVAICGAHRTGLTTQGSTRPRVKGGFAESMRGNEGFSEGF